jgi:hypothetical protein
MLKKILLATALVMAGAFPAAADEAGNDDANFAPHCTAPVPPPVIDGAKATQADLDAGKSAVGDFLSASDKYQRCLRKFYGGKQDMAQFAKTSVPNYITKGVETRIADNQHQKEQVGQDYNTAVTAFNARSGKP